MYRRRKARSTWFPVLGTTYSTEGNSWEPSWLRARVTPVNDAGNPDTGEDSQSISVFAVLPDQTQQISAHDADFTLRDYVEGQDWALDSIVGSVFVNIDGSETISNEPADTWSAVLVTVGFFVANADETATNSPEAELPDLAPQSVDNIRSPWIWRRSWILQNPNFSTQSLIATGEWPTTNAVYTGNNGVHIRTKTKRRIRRNQRLFCIVQATGYDPGRLQVANNSFNQPGANVLLDIRVCGKMRKSRNQSAFQ